MTALGLGTYRVADVAAAAAMAAGARTRWIDTAPVYAGGRAQRDLAPVLAAWPEVQVSTKIGHLTSGQAAAVARAGILGSAAASVVASEHCIDPRYVDYQLAQNGAELGRDRVDLVYLHNPERAGRSGWEVRRAITAAFGVLEWAASAGRIGGYGVATWDGFDGAFTVEDLLDCALRAAGGDRPHLAAVQLPISLVRIGALADALKGRGPLPAARDAGLHVWASSPLHGGELAAVSPGLTRRYLDGADTVDGALRAVASAPGLHGVLLSTSNRDHWDAAVRATTAPAVPAATLRELTSVVS